MEGVGQGGGSVPVGTVTFLLTDVEASTQLWQRAPDAAAAAVGRLDAMIAAHAADHGAYRPRDQGEGDSALLAFTRARDALACALALQLALVAEPWPEDAAVRVRMAVHTGEAELSDGNYKGTAVHRCARVRALAHGGQVLLSDTTVQLLRDRLPDRVELRDLGTHQLRGLDHAEHVFQLCHPSLPPEFGALASSPEAAADGEPVPLPAALARRPEGDALDVFVGREENLAHLTERFEKLRDGGAELVMLSGEAGIGKTCLAAELARRAHAAGATVLHGRSDEELGIPYQPWIEALTHLVRHAPGAVPRREGAELAGLVPLVREVVAELPVPVGATDPETARYMLFGAVAALLARASADAPVLIVLDDLHWAEKSSLSLLRHLVGARVPLRVLIVATYRDSDVGRNHPLSEALAALWREPGVERVAVGGLDDTEIFVLLEAAAGYDVDDDVHDLARALRRETDGNPFFAREIMRHLTETGAIYRDEGGRWHANFELSDARLPASVREVVGQRIARLGEHVQRVLATAAVVGRDFDLDLLARVTERSEDELLDILDEAMAATVVEEVPGRADQFAFAHALIQRTLYEDLGAARRGRLHRRVAEALEELCEAGGGDRVGELAHHWAAATAPVQTTKAIDYARLAGDRALGALAPDEAILWYSQALELLGADEGSALTRCDVLIALGTAQCQAGDPAFRQTLLDASRLAEQAGDVDRLVRAALANHRGSESSPGEVDSERVGVLEAALDAVGAVETTDRARLLATLAVELTYSGDLARITALADEAVGLARRLDDPPTLVHALNAHHGALRLPETLESRLVTTREAIDLAESVGDPSRQFSALRQGLQAALESGDRAARDRCVEGCRAIATRVGQPFFRWVDAQNRAIRLLLDGDPAAAEMLADEAFAIGTECGQPDALVIYGIQLLNVRMHQGRTGEIVDVVAQGVADRPGLPGLRAALARLYHDADRDEEARTFLDESAAVCFEDVPHDENWILGMSQWAQLAAALGAVDTAGVLYEKLAPWAGQIPTAVVAIAEPIDYCLGVLAALLSHAVDADAHFAAAETTARAFGAPFFIARTLLERVCLAISTGSDDADARARLDEALEIAQAHGYALVEQRALALRAQLSA